MRLTINQFNCKCREGNLLNKIMKSLKNKTFLTVAVALAMAANVGASDKTVTNPYSGVLATVTSAELPAKAAALVTKADAKSLKQTTVDVVRSAVGLNPAAAPAIVGSIAQSSPSMAGPAAATAVTLVPNQVIAIARAAAAAAPNQAGPIVEAICRVLPSNYQTVASAVAEVVPGAGKSILAAIASAIPELKTTISQTLAAYDGKIPSVSTVLTQVAQAASTANTTALSSGTPLSSPRGPGAVPPQVPISGTPPVINPGAGTPAPPGGHNYSAP
jgi:hypothetical protein